LVWGVSKVIATRVRDVARHDQWELTGGTRAFITNPRSAPLELQATVPDYMVPFVPILQQGEEPFSMFVDLQNKYDWVLRPVVRYPSVDRLIEVLEDKVVRRAEAKFNKLLARRNKRLRVENV
jgi:hypothetical protein